MNTPAERLRWARQRAGHDTASDVARAFGWPVSTYIGHENGDRVPKRTTAIRYARAFKVRWEWLLEGDGQASPPPAETVPILGTVNAGAKVRFATTIRRKVASPPTDGDVIALVGESNVMPGLIETDWLVYCAKSRRVPTDDDIGKLCLISLDGDEKLIGRLFRGRERTFDVVSLTFETFRDVEVEWISNVEWIKPSG